MIANKKEINKLKKEFVSLVKGYKKKITQPQIDMYINSRWYEDDYPAISTYVRGYDSEDGIEDVASIMSRTIEKIVLAQAELKAKHTLEIKEFIAKTEQYTNHDEIWDILWAASPY